MRSKLTDTYVSNLKFRHPQYTAWDALLPGFGVRVGSRSKTFIVMTGKARKRITLGHYPAITLQKAREAARLKMSNPLGLPLDNSSVSAAIENYLAAIVVKDRTHRDYTRLLNSHLKPAIGIRKIEDITARDILSITDCLKNRPAERYHCHAAMQTFFNWCVPRHIPASPMAGLKNPSKPNERDRILADAELKAVWNAAGNLGNYGNIIRLIMLLGLRKGEPIGPNTTLAHFGLLAGGVGFPNQFFSDSWVVGIGGRPWLGQRWIGRRTWSAGCGHFWLDWVTRHGGECVPSTCRD
jgi:hypothetical protein